jgi:putative peptide zinc metalloprotease protein
MTDASAIDRPKLRQDLIVSRQRAAGETFFVIKDPVRGSYFRFREAERFITEQLDGETSLGAVQRRAEEEFGAKLSMDTLRSFVLNLKRMGFLDTGEEKSSSSRRRRRQWVRGSLLYLRFPAFDPDSLFNWLGPKVWFFHTPNFVVFSAALILAAIGATLTHWSELAGDIDRLYQASAIPLIVLTVFIVVGAHEFAHGLTCKHFGGEVHELGFLLIYFQPAFYCNVSDAWLFPERSKRLWVGFAGPFFELFIWAIATFTWLITNVDTLINFIALIVMTTSGIKTLFNFNPLIKLDGYYLLSDYLEMPNLRKRAFRYLGDGFKKLFGLAVEVSETPTARERRIYFSYGLMSTIASFSLIAIIFVQAGTVLIENNQPILLTLFIGFLSLRVRQRLRRMFSRSGDPDEEDGLIAPEPALRGETDDNKPNEKRPSREPVENKTLDNPSPEEPGESKALEKRPADKVVEEKKRSSRSSQKRASSSRSRNRRSKRNWKLQIFWLLILAAIPAILYFGKAQHRVAGQFSVLPIQSLEVRADIEGIIEYVAVTEGDQVRAGELIARLSDKDLRPELAKTEAMIQQAQAKLKMLEAGPTAMEIEVGRAAVVKAEESLKFAHSRADRDRRLFNEQLLSRKDMELTQELAVTSENAVTEARSKLNVILQGSRPEEIAATRAEIEGLVTQRSHLENKLQRLNIHSSTAGIISTPARQLKELRGQLVNKGDMIAKIYDPKAMRAEISIPEKEITDVKVGQRVSLKALTYPDLTFEGTVTAIGIAAQGSAASSAQSSPSSSKGATTTLGGMTGKTILVSTRLDNSQHLLKPEMSGLAKIYCGERRLIDLLTWRFARVIKVEFWSWW